MKVAELGVDELQVFQHSEHAFLLAETSFWTGLASRQNDHHGWYTQEAAEQRRGA
jgi:hypothetical protein